MISLGNVREIKWLPFGLTEIVYITEFILQCPWIICCIYICQRTDKLT